MLRINKKETEYNNSVQIRDSCYPKRELLRIPKEVILQILEVRGFKNNKD